MKQYKIFTHPSGPVKAVKQGWSWPAFFFSFIWALVKKMWGLGAGVLIGCIVLGAVIGAVAGEKSGDSFIKILSIVISLVFGAGGNVWVEKNLISRGYEQKDTVTAANPEGAEALYLKGAASA